MADEYMDVVYKLWESSWRDDAVIKNAQTGQYAAADRVRKINHKGQFFNVPGPHICEPSPQRTPFLFQAGTSKSGRDFGAKHAEAVFLEGQKPEKIKPSIDAMRQLAAEKYGRDPSHIKFIAAINIFVAETDEEAEAKRKEILSYGDKDGALALFGGWTGIDMSVYSDDEDFRFVKMPAINSMIDHWSETVPGAEDLKWNKATIAEYLNLGGIAVKAVGSPKTVVDIMEEWVEVAGVDGFNLYNMILPGSYEDIIKWVLPELRARGLFRDAVTKDLTARQTFLGEGEGWLLSDHPGRQFRWVPEIETNENGKRSGSEIGVETAKDSKKIKTRAKIDA
jgi:FMN-dependent oxidoreductase (nitrilotriacetate monooxygenase family)